MLIPTGVDAFWWLFLFMEKSFEEVFERYDCYNLEKEQVETIDLLMTISEKKDLSYIDLDTICGLFPNLKNYLL